MPLIFDYQDKNRVSYCDISTYRYRREAMLSGKTDGPAFDRRDTQNLQQALGRITSELSNALESSGSYIYIVGEDQNFNPLVAGGPISEKERAVFFSRVISPDTDVLAYRMLARPVTIVSNQAQSDQRVTPSILTEMSASAALAIPVIGGKELTGLLLVIRSGNHGGEFTPSEIRMAEWFAVAIALALENARLYHQTQNSLSDSRALHQVTLAILQKLELKEVLQIVCDEAQRMTYSSGSSVALLESDDWLRVMYCAGENPRKVGAYFCKRLSTGKSHPQSRPAHYQ
jgi:GAF domain-containing protein